MLHPERPRPGPADRAARADLRTGPQGPGDHPAEIADGLFSVNNETDHAREFSWGRPRHPTATVLEDGEPLDSPRVRAAAGAGHFASRTHATYEFGGDVTRLARRPGMVWTSSPPSP